MKFGSSVFKKKKSVHDKGNMSQKELKMFPSPAAINQKIWFCVIKEFRESDLILCKTENAYKNIIYVLLCNIQFHMNIQDWY